MKRNEKRNESLNVKGNVNVNANVSGIVNANANVIEVEIATKIVIRREEDWNPATELAAYFQVNFPKGSEVQCIFLTRKAIVV